MSDKINVHPDNRADGTGQAVQPNSAGNYATRRFERLPLGLFTFLMYGILAVWFVAGGVFMINAVSRMQHGPSAPDWLFDWLYVKEFVRISISLLVAAVIVAMFEAYNDDSADSVRSKKSKRMLEDDLQLESRIEQLVKHEHVPVPKSDRKRRLQRKSKR